jgi:hypothetical protein
MACLSFGGRFGALFTQRQPDGRYLQTQNEVVLFLNDDLEGDALTAFDKELRSIRQFSSVKIHQPREGSRSG